MECGAAAARRSRAAQRRNRDNVVNIAVVGFGVIGSAIGAVLAECGNHVVGIDTNGELIAALRRGDYPATEPGLAALTAAQVAQGRLRFSPDVRDVADADVIVLTVGTPIDGEMNADLSAIRAACENIAPHIREGQLIVVKSTVPPGTTRNVVARILRERAAVHVAFAPERLAEGQALDDLRTIPIIVGGVDDESSRAARDFWTAALPVDVITVSSSETAELVKLANNLWIDLNIALAHDLARVCDALPYRLDVLEVIRAANTLKKGQHYTNILTPSVGVGGYCLTKDPWFVDAIASQHGAEVSTPRVSRGVNDAMPAYAAGRLANAVDALGMERRSARVAVLGLAFKSNSGDMRSTPVLSFIAALRALGFADIAVCDPLVDPRDAVAAEVSLVSWEVAATGAACVALLAGHKAFHAIGIDAIASRIRPGGVVFDGRYYFSRDEIETIKAMGLNYVGIGRE
jgi:UDP-N-acetyl-D-mannosaminuronic acid dehydrogenase